MLTGVAFPLYFDKSNDDRFIKLWRYLAWSNQTLTVFTFTLIAMYLIKQGKTFLFVLIPGTFYLFVISSYIFHQKIGFGPSDTASYGLAAVLSIIYVTGIF